MRLKRIPVCLTTAAIVVALILEPRLGQALTQPFNSEMKHESEPTVASDEQASSLEEQIQHWINSLSKQPGFAHWRKATWQQYPLGPGMHGWIVIIGEDNRDLGYIVVTSTAQGGHVITEYGLGEYPLFSLRTLYRSMQLDEAINPQLSFPEFVQSVAVAAERHYNGPAEAIWKVERAGTVRIYDGKTGEAYPEETMHQEAVASLAPEAEAKPAALYETTLVDASNKRGPAGISEPSLTLSIENPSFDPFEHLHWMFEEENATVSTEQLIEALKDTSRITYTADILNNQVKHALAVIGIHLWNQQTAFITVDHYGQRFIRFDALAEQGSFHIPAQLADHH